MSEYIKNPAIITKVIDEEMILLNSKSGDYFGLNEIGANIWSLLDDYSDIEAITEHLLSEYEVDKGILEKDINEFIDNIKQRNIIFQK